MTMNLLAVDTSGPFAYVAAATSSGARAHAQSSTGNSHNEELPNLVARVMSETGIKASEIQQLIVGVGPGSFTGLRIGLSYVQGLSFAQTIPIRAVSSLAAYAQTCSSSASTVIALSDARRDEVFFGAYSF